jgi:CPA2 family monovalent cation:H+ antiporter-2
MQNLIPVILLAVAVATALNVFLRRFNMPTVVGYIITGAIIGSVMHFDAHGDETLHHIAEFGIVFLMFTIGLEVSFAHLKEMKKEVLAYGVSQVVGTALVMGALAYFLFGFEIKSAIIIGSALALSSTAIVLKMLNESGRIKTPVGRSALGILIFQDIAVIPILLMITIFTSADKSLGALLAETAIDAVITVGALVLAGKFLLGRLFRIVSATNSKEIYMGSILLTVVGASYFAHHFGFSYSLGGFIAGMMIADTIYKYQVEADLIPFRDLLLGVFFVSVGLQIDLNIVVQNVLPILGLVIGLMVVKTIVLFLIVVVSAKKQDALKTALTLSQVGEFALVVLSMVLSSQMMDPAPVQILIVTIVLSMIATPFLIDQSDNVVRLVFRTKMKPAYLDAATMLSGHVLLLGFGSFGQLVAQKLDKIGIDYVAITDDTDDYVKAREMGKSAVYGDVSDRVILQQVGIQKAMSTILALDEIDEVKRASAAISMIDPNLKVIAKVPTEQEKEELESFDHQLVLDGNTQTAGLIVDQIRRSQLLAKETSELRHMTELSGKTPEQSIEAVALEQKRLLEVISQSFNAMREGKGVLRLKAFHESFHVLSEIIRAAIQDILTDASLAHELYERINTLLDNQEQLESLNSVLENLGKELKRLEEHEQTQPLTQIAVEGLDAILLTLMDLANAYNDIDMQLLANMTSEDGKGLAGIRQTYLGAEKDLDASNKAILVSATNHMDRLRGLFGKIGANYQKLASSGSAA